MNRLMSTVAALLVAHALVACGGARPIQDESAVESAGGETGRRGRRAPRAGERVAEEDEEAQREERSRRRERARASEDGEDFPLGERVVIPGTGVSIEPPRGTQRSASGSTLVHPRRRIQLVIAAAEGDLSVHQQFRSGMRAEAEEIESRELEVGGVPATLIVDRMQQGNVELERVWVVLREGTRSAAVMGLYAADRAEQLREYVTASVLTTRVDPSVAVDPEAALGYRMEPAEGLQLVRASSTNVTYSTDGEPPAAVGAPMMMLMPLPIDVPAAQRAELCPQILEQLVQVAAGADTQSTALTGEDLVGCDRSATTAEEPRLATYAALVFRGDAAFMVLGSTEARNGDRWISRFRAAARTVQPVAQ